MLCGRRRSFLGIDALPTYATRAVPATAHVTAKRGLRYVVACYSVLGIVAQENNPILSCMDTPAPQSQ